MAIKRKTVAQPAHSARGVSTQRQFSSFCLRLHGQPGIAPLQQFVAGALARLLRAQRLLLVLDTPDGPQVVASQLPAGEVDAALLPAITPWLDEARRKRSVRLRHGPVAAAVADQRSCMVAPLVAPNKSLGFIYADVEGAVGRFDDTDRELLGMLAAQVAVALDNAQSAHGLEATVAAHVAELGDSLARQSATAEVLRMLGSSMTDSQPVFDAIVRSCQTLFKGKAVALTMPSKGMIEAVAFARDGTFGGEGGFLVPWPLDRDSVPAPASWMRA